MAWRLVKSFIIWCLFEKSFIFNVKTDVTYFPAKQLLVFKLVLMTVYGLPLDDILKPAASTRLDSFRILSAWADIDHAFPASCHFWGRANGFNFLSA